MRFTVFIISVFLSISFVSFSQGVDRYCVSSSSGSSSFGSFIELESNMGELMVSTLSSSQGFLTQGFIQSDQFVLTGIASAKSNTSGYIYPNPSSTSVNFMITDITSENVVFEFYNSLGEKVLVYSFSQVTSGNANVTVDVSKLTPGMYMIKLCSVKGGEYLCSFKFSKI